MKKYLRKILFFFCNLMTPRKSSGAVILMYHSISNSKAFIAVKPQTFEKQMKFLKQSGLNCVSFSELVKKLHARESLINTVCVTIDDGYRDNYEIALPILKKYGIPASIFISTGFIGKTRTTKKGDELLVMSEDMIRDLSQGGLVECLPHTHLHKHLTDISKEQAKVEILESQVILERLTGRSIPCFAYPYGDYSEDIIDLLSSLGFKGAVTVKEGIVTPDSKPLELPRMTMSREVSLSEFKYKVAKAPSYLAFVKK